jgi:hypothetical protein
MKGCGDSNERWKVQDLMELDEIHHAFVVPSDVLPHVCTMLNQILFYIPSIVILIAENDVLYHYI